MSHDYSVRNPQIEIMDDFEMTGDLLFSSIEQIARINRILGGDQITLNGVQHFAKLVDRPVKILDIGCGGGHLCREIADWAKKKNNEVDILGIDANQAAIDYSRQLSSGYKNLNFQSINAFDSTFDYTEFDIVVLTLTLHHFSNQEIETLLKRITDSAKVGVVVNDLERNKLAYQLYQLLCTVFNFNEMVKYDGSISVQSGFKKSELEQFSKQLNISKYSIKWRWAFRYEWLLQII